MFAAVGDWTGLLELGRIGVVVPEVESTFSVIIIKSGLWLSTMLEWRLLARSSVP